MGEKTFVQDFPLAHDVFASIPQKFYVGFRSVELEVTSFDATKSHVVLGTNSGCAFLHNRDSGTVIKIIANQNNRDVVTCVKILIGLDYQIALGTSDGNVVIVIFSTTVAGTTKQVKKFSLGKLHNAEVCSLTWSLNGMKLFSGDLNGEIFCSSVNFEQNTCNAKRLYSEGSEIVQMEYKHKLLLVATKEKVTLHTQDETYDVGTKPVRSGNYGACFNPNSTNENDLKIFSARPSLRLWVADTNGTVLSTIKLKGLILNCNHIICLSNNEDSSADPSSHLEFGHVLSYQENYLLSYHEKSLYIIDLRSNTVCGVTHSLDGLIDVAATDDEIFILRKNRVLHRLSDMPDVKDTGYMRQDKETSNFQGVKNPFLGMKKNFSPLMGALQSKMSNISMNTGSLTTKARELKDKVASMPVVEMADHFFTNTKREKDIELEVTSGNVISPTNDLHEVSEHSLTCDGNSSDVGVIRDLLQEMIDYINDIDCQDTLHSQGNMELPPFPMSPGIHDKVRRFEEIDSIIPQNDSQEIVFHSKKKPKKKNKSKEAQHRDNNSTLPCDLHSHQISSSSVESFFSIHGEEERKQHEIEVAQLLNENLKPTTTTTSAPEEANTFPQQLHTDGHSASDHQDINNSTSVTISKESNEETDNVKSEDETSQITLLTHEETQTSEKIFHVEGLNTHLQESENPHNDVILHPILHSGVTSESLPQNTHYPVDSPVDCHANVEPCDTHLHATNSLETYDNENIPECVSPITHSMKAESRHEGEERKKLTSEVSPSTHPISPSVEVDEPSIPDIYAVDSGAEDFESEHEKEEEEEEETDSDDSETQQQPPVDDLEVAARDAEYFEIAKQHAKHLTSVTLPHRVADVWQVLDPPGYTVASIGASGNFVCHITFRDRVYLVEETSIDQQIQNIKWRKLSKRAAHISISPSGDFAWIVTRSGNVYATQWPINITSSNAGEVKLDWQKISHSSTFVAVGVTEAWVVDSNGKITRQVGLSRSHFCTRGGATVPVSIIKEGKILDDVRVAQVVLSTEVVWISTGDGTIYCKSLSKVDTLSPWEKVSPPTSTDGDQHEIKLISGDSQCTVWCVNDIGEIWFRSSVTCHEPRGKHWWQVYMNEYLQKPRDSVAAQTMKMMSDWVYGTSKARSVSVSMGAVWVASINNKMHVAKGPVTGNAWKTPKIAGISPSTRWSHITSSSFFAPDSGGWEGVVWLTHGNGEVIRFSSQRSAHPQRATSLQSPTNTSSEVTCFSASRESLWMILSSGEIFVRSGVSGSNPTGTDWHAVHVSEQLGDRKMVHVSCGSNTVWALDDEGNAYVRMGATFSESHVTMMPAWLPIDLPKYPGGRGDCKLTQVVCGPSDLNVWALDNNGNIFVRFAVTMDMPVGSGWKLVEGTTAKQLSISNHSVWALRHDGALLRRYGMTYNDCLGDYWKKMPGQFESFTATPYDELWALDTHHQLRAHVTHLYRPPMVAAMCDESDDDEESEKSTFPGSRSRDTRHDDSSWEFI